MHPDELKVIFDQQAPNYDKQWSRMAPIRDCHHFLLESIFGELHDDAKILCVGMGTGAELAHLARIFPRVRFTAVDPSREMIRVCRQRMEAEGATSRCQFHEGYLDALSVDELYDGATCFLVSQFILSQEARTAFYRTIANRLRVGGILAMSDLAAEVNSRTYDELSRTWFRTMSEAGISPEGLERMRQAYSKDVAILPPHQVASLIEAAGFEPPVQYFQASMIHAWFTRRR